MNICLVYIPVDTFCMHISIGRENYTGGSKGLLYAKLHDSQLVTQRICHSERIHHYWRFADHLIKSFLLSIHMHGTSSKSSVMVL